MSEQSLRILLLDDEKLVLRAMSRLLEDNGFTVITAESAAEAEVVLGATNFDAIICDNEMPSVSGIQFLTNIRDRFSGMARFMLTGSILSTSTQRTITELGVTCVFPKPCDAREIATTVRETVHNLQAGTEQP